MKESPSSSRRWTWSTSAGTQKPSANLKGSVNTPRQEAIVKSEQVISLQHSRTIADGMTMAALTASPAHIHSGSPQKRRLLAGSARGKDRYIDVFNFDTDKPVSGIGAFSSPNITQIYFVTLTYISVH